jgi:hypothetical protein
MTRNLDATGDSSPSSDASSRRSPRCEIRFIEHDPAGERVDGVLGLLERQRVRVYLRKRIVPGLDDLDRAERVPSINPSLRATN